MVMVLAGGISMVKVKRYKRKVKGKTQVVKKHDRKMRKLGKKIHYKTVGKFQVAHDELGNFRGSKIIKFKKKSSNNRKRIIYDDLY